MILRNKWNLRPTEQLNLPTQLVNVTAAQEPKAEPEMLLTIHNAGPSYPTPLASSAPQKAVEKISWLWTHPHPKSPSTWKPPILVPCPKPDSACAKG